MPETALSGDRVDAARAAVAEYEERKQATLDAVKAEGAALHAEYQAAEAQAAAEVAAIGEALDAAVIEPAVEGDGA